MHPKDAEGIANSVDPDQAVPKGVVWSGSALFAQTCLSINLGTLQYYYKYIAMQWNVGWALFGPRQANLCLQAFHHNKF